MLSEWQGHVEGTFLHVALPNNDKAQGRQIPFIRQ